MQTKVWEWQPSSFGPKRRPAPWSRKIMAATCAPRVVVAKGPSSRGKRSRPSFTDLLSDKPLDVDLRQLQYSALREKGIRHA